MFKKLLIIIAFLTFPFSVSADAVLGKVNGMICMACQDKVQAALEKAAGNSVDFMVSWPDAIAVVNLDDKSKFTPEDFTKVVTNAGFQVEKVARVKENIKSLEEGLAKLEEL